MAVKPFTLDTRHFAKKGDAILFFRSMLNRYNVGDTVSDQDFLDLFALLKHHTEHNKKLGCGIVRFEIMNNLYNTKCFELVRHDGSRDDFSYRHCISPVTD